ncbi:MAG: VOC family protein [Pseudomonadota bacterium]
MGFTPKDFTVWTEIPVSDLKKAITFYETVTGAEMVVTQMGPYETAVFPVTDPANGVSGHLYEGKPAGDGTGPTIHMMFDGKLEDAAERVRAAGGKVVSDEPVSIPEGRFVYCMDPDGNSISLFEAGSGGAG